MNDGSMEKMKNRGELGKNDLRLKKGKEHREKRREK